MPLSGPRVAIVADRFPPHWGGGIASAHYQLYRVLKAAGLPVKAFTFFDGAAAATDADEVVRRGAPGWLVSGLRRAANAAFRIADPGKAAYHTADILVRAWGARRLGAVLHVFRPQVAVFPDHGAPSLFIGPLPGCRRVLVVHHNPSRFVDLPFLEPHSRRDARLAMAAERRAVRTVDMVIAPSRYMESVFRASHDFRGRLEVLPNLVDAAYLDAIPARDPRPGMGLEAGAPVVYIPGGGNKFKGAAFVPEIARRLADCFGAPLGLYVSGAMPDEARGRLRALPASVRVHAPGVLDGPSNIALVKACSFGVYPTLAENFSMALVEAALVGLPMVTFDVGGNREIVVDGETGRLAPAFDLEALLAAAAALLTPGPRQALARRTFDHATRHLGSRHLAERWVETLTSLA